MQQQWASIFINTSFSQMQTAGFAVQTFSMEVKQSNNKNFLKRKNLSPVASVCEEIVQFKLLIKKT